MAKRLILALGVALATAAGAAFAHSMMKGSAPPDGAVLSAAPAELVLEFARPVRLTVVKLVPSRDEEIALAVDRAAPAASSTRLALPKLEPGRYKVRWSALAEDGHAMSGQLRFTIAKN